MPADHREQSMYFTVYRQSPIMYGFTWKVFTDRTSFYLTSRHALKDWKFSLHGPDPEIDAVAQDPHHATKKFKWAPVRNADPNDLGSIAFNEEEVIDGPIYFPGHDIGSGIKHVVRFRWPWWMFIPRGVSAAGAGAIKSRERKRLAGASVLPFPTFGEVTDLDLFIADGAPYWPNEEVIKERNAGLPPLQNSAGQWMTAVVTKNLWDDHPTPEGDSARRKIELPTSPTSHVRGLYQVGTPEGYLVVEETWIPQPSVDAAVVMRDENAG